MKYFITGATGFVGGKVASQLRAAGHEVIALVRNPEKAADLSTIGVVIAKGDVTEIETMREPMKGCDGVFHIAGWYKVGARDQSEAAKINIDGTRNVLTIMKELKIPKGVYTSTLAVNSDTHGVKADESYHFEGKHLSEYDRTKAEAHKIAEQFIRDGLPLVIVMPGLVYGPGDNAMSGETWRAYLQKKLPMIVTKTAYSYGYIDDIAHFHILAMEKGRPGEKYIICGPTHTLVEAFRMAKEITGVRLPMVVPPVVPRISAVMMAPLEKIVHIPEMYSSEVSRIIAGITYTGDNTKAVRELGYHPRPLEEGLKQTLEFEMAALGMKKQ